MLPNQTGNYKNAFKCSKCPLSNGEKGCPMWWEIPVERDDNPTVMDIMKGCGYVLMPRVLISVAKAGWTGASEVSKMREEVVHSVSVASSRFLQLQADEALLRLSTGDNTDGSS